MALAAALAGIARAPSGALEPPSGVFELARLNTTYDHLVPEIAPIELGPVVVRLSSPRQTLILKSNRLALHALADGSHAASLDLEFLGKGWLVADIDAAGATSRLEDEVQVLPQKRTLTGRVRIRPSPEGYQVDMLELQKEVEVDIRSRVATDLTATCDRLSVLPLFVVDCAGLDRSLSQAVLPLPAAGGTYLLANELLRDADRRQLDDYLAAARAAARAAVGPAPASP